MSRSFDWELVTRVPVQYFSPIFKDHGVEEVFSWTAWPLKMGSIGYTETSITVGSVTFHKSQYLIHMSVEA
jgi:hypothetical protein